jgi:CHAT domain-containing protein
LLSAAEVTAWDLTGTELVVPASCRSGEGTDAPRTAPQGLRAAFEIAGAKRVVTSLWMLEDEAASEISTQFYRHIADGRDAARSVALRAARLVCAHPRERKESSILLGVADDRLRR